MAFLRTSEQLGELAATLESAHAQSGPAVSTAQQALQVYHLAYRDLCAALTGVDQVLAFQPPTPEELAVAVALSHLQRSDRTIIALIPCMVRRAGGAQDLPLDDSLVEFLSLILSHFKSPLEAPALTYRDLQRVRTPTLVLVGEHEDLWDRAEVVHKARRCLPNLVAAEILEGAGHGLNPSRPG